MKKVRKEKKAVLPKKVEISYSTPPDLKLAPPLKVFIFSWFKKSLEEKGNLPPKEEVGKEIGKRYPNSIFSKKLDVHYSYYKSSFLTLARLSNLEPGSLAKGLRS